MFNSVTCLSSMQNRELYSDFCSELNSSPVPLAKVPSPGHLAFHFLFGAGEACCGWLAKTSHVACVKEFCFFKKNLVLIKIVKSVCLTSDIKQGKRIDLLV